MAARPGGASTEGPEPRATLRDEEEGEGGVGGAITEGPETTETRRKKEKEGWRCLHGGTGDHGDTEENEENFQ